MATWTVRAESDGVESAAQFRLVFRMPDETAKFVKAVSELAFVAIFARAILFIRSAQFRLVAAGIGLLRLCRSVRHWFAVAPVQFSVSSMHLHQQR